MAKKNIEAIYALSPMQQGMLFHTLYAPESGVYCMQLACTLQGDLKLSAFKQAWNKVIDRHPVLRTVFIWEGLDEPRQVVLQRMVFPWQEQDWQAVARNERRERLEAYLQADRSQGFDLSKGPLMRFALMRWAEDDYQFIWSSHHLLTDGWSLPLILKEVFVYYEACRQGQDLYLKPPRPYQDYIAWLKQQDQAQAEAFWRRTLEGFTTPTPLVVGKTIEQRRPDAVEGYVERQITLPATTTRALQNLVQNNQLTLNTLAQGLWAILLNRYSGREDIVFGTTVSGRPAELTGVESMIGLLVNTLPVRVRVAPQAALLSWLQDLQMQQAEMRQYEYSSLAQIQNWSDLPRGEPLFESLVSFQNYPLDSSAPVQGDGLRIRDIRSSEKTNYPLTFIVIPGPELLLKIAYDDQRFDAATITFMLGHLQTLLESIVADPEQRLADLSPLSETERRLLLKTWNAGREEYAQDQCVHQRFEEQAAQTPDAIALVRPAIDPAGGTDKAMTYQSLNQRANQLAHHLQALGVGPEVPVGVCLERSLEMVVGLLGILKAGGAYVPLDPTYPQERLAFMLNDISQDGSAPVLLTQARLMEKLPAQQAQVLCLDTDWDYIAHLSTVAPFCEATPSTPAYVIYTSGSTGTPKGVVVCHDNVTRLFAATQAWFNFDTRDVWTLFHSYAFDFSVWELWGALAYGGRVVIVPYLTSRTPGTFYELLCTQRVTVLNQIPSSFRQLMRAESPVEPVGSLALRLVIFGGEALDLGSLRPWFERHGDQCPQLVNMYGITETTVHVTYRPVTMTDVDESKGSVIGCAIPDLQMYVLDPHSQHPMPVGVPGELYVGGAGLARGYLNHPTLTAERFIPNPYGHKPDECLYRTGDLARYLPNGDVEYLGRIDHQVKIRGFRIELGEIEAALAQHPAVHEALVAAWEAPSTDQQAGSRNRDKRLVAYIIPHQKQIPTVSELRQFLSTKLPDHMIPAAFVTLETLPLSPSGKINRRALPAPDTTRPVLDETFIAPRTLLEKTLAEIWASVLGVDQVGIHDNFFSLGGDSILSIQILAKAREQGLDFSLQQLLQHQTIYELVQELTLIEGETVSTKSIPPFGLISKDDRAKLPQGIEDAYPLARLQVGMLFHSAFSPQTDTAVYHDIFGFHLKGVFNFEALQVAVQRLATRHSALRTSFDLSNYNQPLQLIHDKVDIPLYVQNIRHFTADEQKDALNTWLQKEKNRPFDWTQPPLLRFQVHRYTEETFQFTVSFHHAILDGWSVAYMLTELFQIYLSLLGKNVPAIKQPPLVTFRDFVVLEREAIKSERHRRYWAKKLEDCAIVTIPRWPAMPPVNDVRQVFRHDVPLSAELVNGLNQFAQSASVPLKSVLLAAHLRVLSLLGGQSDVVTGLVSNGRPEETDSERVLGLFLNTLPFRLNLSGGTWKDLVQETFTVERESLPFRLYPLADIQKLHGAQPLFETAFNFVHFHIYQGLQEFTDIQPLGGKSFEETNFTLLANFRRAPFSSQIELALMYDNTTLHKEQVKAIGEYYARALTAMVNNPQENYRTCSLLSEAERDRLLGQWNATQRDYPLDKCLQELFEFQVQQTPNNIAVVIPAADLRDFGTHSKNYKDLEHQDVTLTYDELNKRANQVAHYLRSLKVGPETRVGICMERSREMIVGIYGILKSGGAYVPLDPSDPPDRLAFMMADAQVPVLLTQTQFVDRLPAHTARMICLDSDWECITQESEENPVLNVTPDNLAYIIYTSGSTGMPKGAMNTHRGICNRLLWMQDAFCLTKADRVLQKTPFSFDVSVWEFFWPLLNGARLVVAQPEGHKDSAYLAHLINEQKITVMHFVPSMLEVFLQEPKLENCYSLRKVICSGETLSYTLQERFFTRLDTDLYNLYGPTEAAIDVTFWACQRDNRQPFVPIGYPIANIQIYILDQQLQPVPAGVPGELFIGGIGLGRGYYNRPRLTAEKFIPHPFGQEPGTRLYRTGDLTRYLPDGTIDFLGRLDYQVKVRGFRVELGEIEAALLQHPAVEKVVVIARQMEYASANDLAGSTRLVAYIIPQGEQPPTVSGLRRFLQINLPEYMVPALFVMLKTLPLTSSGKVDRRALPAPDATRPQLDEAFVAPDTPEEKGLVEIWSSVLGLDRVGIHDNYFALGGDSILSIQVLARAREQGLNFSLQQLFQYPTIRELARELVISESVAIVTEKVEPFSLLSEEDRAKFSTAIKFNRDGH